MLELVKSSNCLYMACEAEKNTPEARLPEAGFD